MGVGISSVLAVLVLVALRPEDRAISITAEIGSEVIALN
jgi:hypothetical protein